VVSIAASLPLMTVAIFNSKRCSLSSQLTARVERGGAYEWSAPYPPPMSVATFNFKNSFKSTNYKVVCGRLTASGWIDGKESSFAPRAPSLSARFTSLHGRRWGVRVVSVISPPDDRCDRHAHRKAAPHDVQVAIKEPLIAQAQVSQPAERFQDSRFSRGFKMPG